MFRFEYMVTFMRLISALKSMHPICALLHVHIGIDDGLRKKIILTCVIAVFFALKFFEVSQLSSGRASLDSVSVCSTAASCGELDYCLSKWVRRTCTNF